MFGLEALCIPIWIALKNFPKEFKLVALCIVVRFEEDVDNG